MSCGCAGWQHPAAAILLREGTHQVGRALAAPHAERMPVDERRPEHAMVFAAAFARHLPFVGLDDRPDGTWEDFFGSDISARLARVAVDDVGVYRTAISESLRQLAEPPPAAPAADLIRALGEVFDRVGTLALRLDVLHSRLPGSHPLRTLLGDRIRGELSPMLRRLIGYHLAGRPLGVVKPAAAPPTGPSILGQPVVALDSLVTGPGLSADWCQGVGQPDWAGYLPNDLAPFTAAFGDTATAVARVNHLATHTLFVAACGTFLATYSRVVEEARGAVHASLRGGTHEPHYALFLAFLELLGYARDQANTLTQKHLDFYYRQVLGILKRPAEPGHAHVLVELAKHAATHPIAAGARLKAGKDDTGADAYVAVDRELIANKGAVTELRSLYRHPRTTAAETMPMHVGRLFATPTAAEGESWHPFARKTYLDGELKAIDMAPAEVGFAIASHHLWLAEGQRGIWVQVDTAGALPATGWGMADLRCRLTTEKGWLEVVPVSLDLSGTPSAAVGSGPFRFGDIAAALGLPTPRTAGFGFLLKLDGNAAQISTYVPKVHGYGFDTSQPVLLVTLRHRSDAPWSYPVLASTQVAGLRLVVWASGIKTLTMANDQGPIDPAKPFLAYGSGPGKGSALVVGCKEALQKTPLALTLTAAFAKVPAAHGNLPKVSLGYLAQGDWQDLDGQYDVSATGYAFGAIRQPALASPDLTPNAPYSTASRGGFVRLRLDGGFGTDTYPTALAAWIAGKREGQPALPTKPTLPVPPVLNSLTLAYLSAQQIDLSAPKEGTGRFFHVTPFGHAEVSGKSVPLLPRYLASPDEPAEGELYLGVRGLVPPQNLALLVQVADGTADPLVAKPDDHLRWSYLRGSEWAPFPAGAVDDLTDGLLSSGIVTLAVPADATVEHTVMPRGLHWIRVAVASASDAVCRLVAVAAQALRASSVMLDGIAPSSGMLPPDTITKLAAPDAAVKGLSQPYPSFGGRPVESAASYATRVSERLRHKDRAIALWDYEHLVLEAFPGIYQARCLNHTRYEPTASGQGVYSELAPGHVTMVTIPDLAVPNPRDPLRPSTSLRVLGEVERFLTARTSCFVTLHVRNPLFEEVRAHLRVRFREGVDETFHLRRLRREITEFLSPWAFRGDARPRFNGRVHKSALVSFVEERDYVDYLTDVRLFRRLPGTTGWGPDLDTVAGSRAISILVSAAPADHCVSAIPGDQPMPARRCGCLPGGGVDDSR